MDNQSLLTYCMLMSWQSALRPVYFTGDRKKSYLAHGAPAVAKGTGSYIETYLNLTGLANMDAKYFMKSIPQGSGNHMLRGIASAS
ncbi:hypothetical protein RHMOL_Rhmol02G0290500 [Rhododendron molle]|uniref:Uncharacterized protein n=1 Tax=Rhododendron molle TaxID=49168 RepID=A0ACC0PWQ8_RHOML|nr:hypothetical protein RHMOL_Rhmol02G0290500 [Rhododendron molle]